ncbi:PAS domain S-box protein [Cylindrospermum sp. FACHB-282]|uniref:PAS domain S-box protein n=1 Tax=Cylindrospermum sp. FACHB-282 TaxID=2692794 RepID=UPI003F8D11DE
MVGGPGKTQEISYPEYLIGIHPDDRQKVDSANRLAIANLGSLELEYRVLIEGQLSEYKWFLTRAIVLSNTTGSPYRLIGVSVDINDRVQAQAALQQANQELEMRVVERTIALQQINQQLVSEIGDRQMVEKQLRQSQKMLQLIMDTIPHSIFWKDINSVFLGCNRNFAKMAGFDNLEDIVGKTDYDLLFNQEEAHFYYSCDAEVMKTNTPQYQIITPQQQADGKQIWLETNKVPLHNPEGNVVGMLGTLENITARKQAQAALEKSEERFRFLAESIPQKVWITQANGSIEYVNQRSLDFFGCNLEQILGWGWQEWVHPEDQPRYLALWQKSIVTGTPLEIECRLLRGADKNYRWHLIRALPLRDRQGKILNWFGTSTDIDDRVSAEVALRESEQRYHTMATVSPVGLFRTDSVGNCLYVNERWCEITGLKKHQAAGFGWFAAIHPQDQERVATEWHQAVSQGLLFRSEYRFQRPDASVSWVFGQAVAELTDQGEVIAYIGTITDISQQQAALCDRQRAEAALAERVRLADFRADVDAVLTQNGTLETMMCGCTQALVKHLNAAFARIWKLNKDDQVLELQVSSGIYTHIDGPDSRIAVGLWKIGLIAESGQPHLTNSLQDDDPISDQEGMIAFAGYPLIVEGETLGVIAMYCRQILTESTFKALGIAADAIAIGIKRKQTEEALRDSEERFRNLVEASSDWVWEVDANSLYTYVSPKVRDILGYEPEEVLGKTPLDFMSPPKRGSIAQDFAAIFVAPQPFQCRENFQIHKNGHLVVLETSGVPVFDSEGKLSGYRGMSRDITQRQQEAAALREMQQRLQYLLASSPAVIYTCKSSNDFGAIFISKNVTAMMGYEAQKFVENSSFWFSHIHPEDAPQVLDKLSKVLELGSYSLEYRFLHQDNTYRWVYDQGKVVRDEIGNPLELVGYWADITNRKQLEQELRVALEKEKELNELKSRFVSMTSHEFRTPLSTILSSSELLEHYSHKWTAEKQLTHLHRIQTAVKRMTEMLNDILVIGKVEAGRLEYRPTCFDLVEYCRQLVEEMQMNLSNQNFICFTSEYESLPCCMDDKFLGHILSNLLSNAIKYSPNGNTGKFTLTCQGEQAVFEIQDQGIGIPEEDLPRLFESFHRARNVGNILGTGLGLSIVKNCVEIHKGEISVISTLGVGTKFTVTLPLNNPIQNEVNYA